MTSVTLRTVAATVASICTALTGAELTHIVTFPHWLVSAIALAGIVAGVLVPSPAGATQVQVVKAMQSQVKSDVSPNALGGK
jgi:hypothetical protein